MASPQNSPIPPALQALLDRPGLAELGPGPRAGVCSEAEITEVVSHLAIPPARRELVRALLLLWNDHHETAHASVQDLENADASLVHAILHRREPDFGNAGYWFRRVGQHPSYAALAASVTAAVSGPVVAALVPGGRWDPMAFVASCERALRSGGDPAAQSVLRRIQGMETSSLLSHLLSL